MEMGPEVPAGYEFLLVGVGGRKIFIHLLYALFPSSIFFIDLLINSTWIYGHLA